MLGCDNFKRSTGFKMHFWFFKLIFLIDLLFLLILDVYLQALNFNIVYLWIRMCLIRLLVLILRRGVLRNCLVVLKTKNVQVEMLPLCLLTTVARNLSLMSFASV